MRLHLGDFNSLMDQPAHKLTLFLHVAFEFKPNQFPKRVTAERVAKEPNYYLRAAEYFSEDRKHTLSSLF